MKAPGVDDQIRVAEVMASFSLASDLGLGQPLEHELGVCLSALELVDRLACTAEECSDVYYVALLAHVGCTAAAPYFAGWAGGDEIHFQSARPTAVRSEVHRGRCGCACGGGRLRATTALASDLCV